MSKKAQENLGVIALREQSPQIKAALKRYGHEVGDAYMSPKTITSLAIMNSLEKEGITFDSIAGALRQGLEAKQYITRKNGKDTEEIVEKDDIKTRLATAKIFIQMMGIDKGMDIPEPVQIESSSDYVDVKLNFLPDEEYQTTEEEVIAE